ncbi:MAG: transporter substrate-binding protein, partial [Microvirga sp.]|nr:transporter substrate-binding protein [Microvirga sp.]
MRFSKTGRLCMSLAAALLLSSAAVAQQAKQVTIATEGAFPPWNHTEAGGKIAGFDVEIAQDLCRRAQMTCTIVGQDWAGIIPALQAGKHDAVMSGMNITDKRLAVIGFSRPYATSRHVFATVTDKDILGLPNAGKLVDITELNEDGKATIEEIRKRIKGKSIGVQSSTNALAFLEQHFKGDISIREYKTSEQHDLDLTAGRIDGIFVDYASASAASQKKELEGMKVVGPAFRGGLLGRGVAIGLRKD